MPIPRGVPSEQAAIRTFLIQHNKWQPGSEPLLLPRGEQWFELQVFVNVEAGSAAAANLDIDVSALLFNTKGTFLESVGFSSPLSSDRAVTHGGDEVRGAEGCLSERVEFNLELSHKRVYSICIVVSCYAGASFQAVQSAEVRLVEIAHVRGVLGQREVARTLYPREALLARPRPPPVAAMASASSFLCRSSDYSAANIQRSSSSSSLSAINELQQLHRSGSTVTDRSYISGSVGDADTTAAGAAAVSEPVTALLLGDLRRSDTTAGAWLLRAEVLAGAPVTPADVVQLAQRYLVKWIPGLVLRGDELAVRRVFDIVSLLSSDALHALRVEFGGEGCRIGRDPFLKALLKTVLASHPALRQERQRIQLTSLLIDLWDQICTNGRSSSNSTSNSSTAAPATAATSDATSQHAQLQRVIKAAMCASSSDADYSILNSNSSSCGSGSGAAIAVVPAAVAAGTLVSSTKGSESGTADPCQSGFNTATAATASNTDSSSSSSSSSKNSGVTAAVESLRMTTKPAGVDSPIPASSAISSSMAYKGGETVLWEDFTAFWVEAGMVNTHASVVKCWADESVRYVADPVFALTNIRKPTRLVTRPNFNRLIVHEEHSGTVRLCEAATGAHVQTLSPDTLTAVASMTQHDAQSSSFVTVMDIEYVDSKGWIAISASDYAISLWNYNPSNHQAMWYHSFHSRCIQTLIRWIPHEDGYLLSAGVDHSISLWDVTTRSRKATLYAPHSELITDAVYLPQHGQFATCSFDHKVRFWSAATFKPQGEVVASSPLRKIANKGDLLLCIGLDAEAHVLSVTTQRLWCKVIAAVGTTFVGVELLSFLDSRQGMQTRAITAESGGTFSIWDIGNGQSKDGSAQMLLEFNINALCPLVGQVIGFNAVFRPREDVGNSNSNGSSVTASSELSIAKIWPDIIVRGSATSCRVNTQQIIRRVVPATFLLYDAKSKNIAAATGGSVRFWDVQTSDPMRTIDLTVHEGGSSSDTHSKGGSSSSSNANRISRPHEVTCMITDMPNQRQLYIGGSEGQIKLLNIVTGYIMCELKGVHNGAVTCLIHCPNANILVSAGADSKVVVFTESAATYTHKPEVLRTLEHAHPTPIACAAVNEPLSLIATASGGDIRLWNLHTLAFEGGVIGHKAEVLQLLFLPGTPLLLSTDTAGECYAWSIDFTSGSSSSSSSSAAAHAPPVIDLTPQCDPWKTPASSAPGSPTGSRSPSFRRGTSLLHRSGSKACVLSAAAAKLACASSSNSSSTSTFMTAVDSSTESGKMGIPIKLSLLDMGGTMSSSIGTNIIGLNVKRQAGESLATSPTTSAPGSPTAKPPLLRRSPSMGASPKPAASAHDAEVRNSSSSSGSDKGSATRQKGTATLTCACRLTRGAVGSSSDGSSEGDTPPLTELRLHQSGARYKRRSDTAAYSSSSSSSSSSSTALKLGEGYSVVAGYGSDSGACVIVWRVTDIYKSVEPWRLKQDVGRLNKQVHAANSSSSSSSSSSSTGSSSGGSSGGTSSHMNGAKNFFRSGKNYCSRPLNGAVTAGSAEVRAGARTSVKSCTPVACHLNWVAHPGPSSNVTVDGSNSSSNSSSSSDRSSSSSSSSAVCGVCAIARTPMIATSGSDGTLRLWTLSHIQVGAKDMPSSSMLGEIDMHDTEGRRCDRADIWLCPDLNAMHLRSDEELQWIDNFSSSVVADITADEERAAAQIVLHRRNHHSKTVRDSPTTATVTHATPDAGAVSGSNSSSGSSSAEIAALKGVSSVLTEGLTLAVTPAALERAQRARELSIRRGMEQEMFDRDATNCAKTVHGRVLYSNMYTELQSGKAINSMVRCSSHSAAAASGVSSSSAQMVTSCSAAAVLSLNARASSSAELIADVPSQLPAVDTQPSAFLQAHIPELLLQQGNGTVAAMHSTAVDPVLPLHRVSSSERISNGRSNAVQHHKQHQHGYSSETDDELSVAQSDANCSFASSSTRALRAPRTTTSSLAQTSTFDHNGSNSGSLSMKATARRRSASLSPLKARRGTQLHRRAGVSSANAKAQQQQQQDAELNLFSKDAAGHNLRKALLLVTLDRIAGGESSDAPQDPQTAGYDELHAADCSATAAAVARSASSSRSSSVVDSMMYTSLHEGPLCHFQQQQQQVAPQVHKKRLESLHLEWSSMQQRFDGYMKDADRGNTRSSHSSHRKMNIVSPIRGYINKRQASTDGSSSVKGHGTLSRTSSHVHNGGDPAVDGSQQAVKPLKLTAFGGYTRAELEMLGNVFLEWDIDGDQTITYDEFVRVANSEKHGSVFKSVKFGMLDTDNSGVIDLHELTALLFSRASAGEQANIVRYLEAWMEDQRARAKARQIREYNLKKQKALAALAAQQQLLLKAGETSDAAKNSARDDDTISISVKDIAGNVTSRKVSSSSNSGNNNDNSRIAAGADRNYVRQDTRKLARMPSRKLSVHKEEPM